MIIAVTGHRPNKLWGYNLDHLNYNKLASNLKTALLSNDCTHAISGMALGVDTVFAKVVLRLRDSAHLDIKLECAIPCLNHSSKWFGESIKEYNKILNLADKVTYVTNEEYNNWCMQKRNEYMVDKCDLLLAVWDGSSGGTGNCVKYAKKKDKNIYIIDPKNI